MSAKITIEHATKIIKKLKARKAQRQSTHHKHYDVIENKKVVLTFGVSHTPHKGKPQSHLPDDLYLNTYQTKKLAECQISRTEYLRILEDDNVI